MYLHGGQSNASVFTGAGSAIAALRTGPIATKKQTRVADYPTTSTSNFLSSGWRSYTHHLRWRDSSRASEASDGNKTPVDKKAWSNGRTASGMAGAAVGSTWDPLPAMENAFLGSDRKAELPAGIRAAFPVLSSLTPGVTALVIGFVLDERTATSLDGVLRKDYTTYTSPSHRSNLCDVVRHIMVGARGSSGYQIVDPDGQPREGVAEQISRLEQACLNWLHASLPGVFAKELRTARPPTAILLVTERATPAEIADMRSPGLGALDLRSFDSWECTDWPGMRIVFPTFPEGDTMRAAMVCRRHDAFPKSDGHHDERSNSTIAFRAHERMDALLSRWALVGMLDGYHEILSALRDSVAAGRSFQSVRHLSALQDLVRSTLNDVAIVAAEAKEFAAARAHFERDLPALTRVKWGNRPARSSETLNERLRGWIDYRCNQIVRGAGALQGTLSTTSNITQAIENIRLQRIALMLAVASTVIALISLFISLNQP